mmetsp:Transcript_52511/g.156651  ORF Transcript_52511/g.156651 Transcript_52511/m.156651 type:complete len:206 (+) Transcript_52511:51-668(+)
MGNYRPGPDAAAASGSWLELLAQDLLSRLPQVLGKLLVLRKRARIHDDRRAPEVRVFGGHIAAAGEGQVGGGPHRVLGELVRVLTQHGDEDLTATASVPVHGAAKTRRVARGGDPRLPIAGRHLLRRFTNRACTAHKLLGKEGGCQLGLAVHRHGIVLARLPFEIVYHLLACLERRELVAHRRHREHSGVPTIRLEQKVPDQLGE